MAELNSHSGWLRQSPPQAIGVAFLCVIFLVGLYLRLSASRYGLPFSYDPDEIAFAEPAINIIRSGVWNPGWFGHPGTTTIYLNVILFELVHSLRTFFLEVPDLASDYYRNPYAYTYTARAAQSAFASFSILLTYVLCRRIGLAAFPSIFAAALVAFSSLHITYSALIRTDTLSAFLMMLSLICCTYIIRVGGYRHYIAAGVFAGLAIATKYPLVICCVAIAIAHILSPRNWLIEWRRLAAAAFATVLATFIASPYLFLDFSTVLANVSHEARTSHGTATGEGFFLNLLWYGERSQHWFGSLALTSAFIGAMLSFVSNDRTRVPVGVFFIVFIAFIASLSLRWDRWLIPVIPVGATLCAITLNALWNVRGRLAIPSALLGLALALAILIPLAMAARDTVAARTASDTRTAAANWMNENLPEGSLVLVSSGGPHLSRDRFKIGLYGFGRESGEVSYDYRNEYVNVIPRFSDPARSDVEKILESGRPDYIALSSKVANHYRDREEWRQFEAIFGAGEIIREIASPRDAERGPTIWIIRVANRD